jgi:hypothetical protein
MTASTPVAPTAHQSTTRPRPTPAELARYLREEDHAFLYTVLLNAAFRAEELGITPDQFLEICRAAAAPHHKLLDSEEVIIEPSPRLKELGFTPERFLEMSETIVSVMRQLLTENLG